MADLRVSVLSLPDGLLGGYCVVYGSPTALDWHGRYFSARTRLYDNSPAGQWVRKQLVGAGRPARLIPLCYEHERGVIGWLRVLRPTAEGVYCLAVLERLDLLQLAHAGLLHFSSYTNEHYRAAEDGELLAWPLVEVSLCSFPAGGAHFRSRAEFLRDFTSREVTT
jgi:hypothetical protein